jgi:CheY-like chemotaxis protein
MYSKVLLIEDEAVLRRVIARNLNARGAQVLEAATAQEAIDLLSESPDLILLDINLPDRSGWDVLRHLKRIGRDIPTVIVSAVRVSPDRLEEFKPLAYLPKPFPIEALMRVIETGRLEKEHIVE